MDDFVPSMRDKNWMKALLRLLKNGATWVTSFATYRIDKHNKRLIVTGAGMDLDGDTWPVEMNKARVAKVAEAIGWRVADKE